MISVIFVAAAYFHITGMGFPTALGQLLDTAFVSGNPDASYVRLGFLKMISLWWLTAGIVEWIRLREGSLSRCGKVLAAGIAFAGLWFPLFYREETQWAANWIVVAGYLAAALLLALSETRGKELLERAVFFPVKSVLSCGLLRQWMRTLRECRQKGRKGICILGYAALALWMGIPVLCAAGLLAAYLDVYFRACMNDLAYRILESLGIWTVRIGLAAASSYAVMLEASWLYGMCQEKEKKEDMTVKKNGKGKYLLAILAVVIILWGLSHAVGRWLILHNAEKQVELNFPSYREMEYRDDHGGFLGDGTTRLVLTFSEEEGRQLQEQMERNPAWQSLPITENLNTFLYGKQEDGYGYIGRAGELELPVIGEGYWYFLDRHAGEGPEDDVTNQPHNDRWLLSRHSYNLTVAIYDTVTRTLYYLEYDT